MSVEILLNEAKWREMDRNLASLKSDVEKKLIVAATLAAAREGVKIAKKTTAFRDRTGSLRDSIKARAEGRFKLVRLRATMRYAHLVELGHGGPVKAAPRPFLKPAVLNSARQADAAMVKTLTRGLKKYGLRKGKTKRGK